MSNRIKAVREVLKLSQREFGEKLGVSRDVISNLESERVQLKELLFHHICQIYNVNPHWLKTGEGEMFNNTPNDIAKIQEALNIFKSLRPEFQDYALEQIKNLVKLQNK